MLSNSVFYVSAAIAVAATVLAITRPNIVHALLYLIVSQIAVAIVLFVLGAPFIAALEVIIYAGAIMVLFVFVIMLLNIGEDSTELERQGLTLQSGIGPVILGIILGVQLVYVLSSETSNLPASGVISPKQVSLALYGPYVLVVELASMLLMAGLIGAYHLGRRSPEQEGKQP